MKLRRLLFTSLCALGLTASSYATSLTGQAYTAKLAWTSQLYPQYSIDSTVTGIVGAGINGTGYEVLLPGYGLELDADDFGRVYSINQGQFYGSDIFTVQVTFTDLVAEQFAIPSGAPFQKNSKFGGASLAVTQKNQLTFSYWGDYTSQYAGVSWYNWWGYSLETNPDYQPGAGSGGNGGGGNNVPEATNTFALFGVAAVGLIGLRKRLSVA